MNKRVLACPRSLLTTQQQSTQIGKVNKMGKTFSQPTYFYQDSTPPDLVDTNGPIYQRTGVVLGNIVPTEVAISNKDNSPVVDTMFNVVSHDLHVCRNCYLPMASDSENAIIAVGLSGTITVSASSIVINPTTVGNSLFLIVQFQDTFTTNATSQLPISVVLKTSSGDDTAIGVGYLSSTDSTGIDSLYATLIASSSNDINEITTIMING